MTVSASAIDHVQLVMPIGREGEARVSSSISSNFARCRSRTLSLDAAGFSSKAAARSSISAWKSGFTAARKAHPAFLVDDLDKLYRELAVAGLVVTTDEPLDGYDRIYVDDPFGNRIEFMAQRSSTTPISGDSVSAAAEGA